MQIKLWLIIETIDFRAVSLIQEKARLNKLVINRVGSRAAEYEAILSLFVIQLLECSQRKLS